MPKASDLVVDEIRRRVIRERLPVGYRLPTELELMEQHGLGRVTVREALRVLERDGLIEVKRGPKGGIFVTKPDVRQLGSAFALLFAIRDTRLGHFSTFRGYVEPVVARLAAMNATDEQRENLVRATEQGRAESTSRAVDFHSMVAEMCGNDMFEFMIDAINVSFERHFRHDMITETDREDTDFAHRRIAQKIAAGDADGAERAMSSHLLAYDEYLKKNGLTEEPLFPEGV
ncbi:FadR/GntR family transcriptional regulator [Actinomadura livida]|uniref:FadR/GntR family transcriptional regulator n=1 Tax=Actinomadura livida TaxID=79909 RepID=A0A7W7MYI6_9ACTN|nr:MULTISPECIES: FCD domain-containing protein [Actinomadura]MBB4775941.1 GntR family transcriptional repressor for pyruvate dehydrogenase complex [Actinomadura catellatispora]GGU16617.1 GntR family transcriptional regulator [Actinomadura livida]